MVKNTGILWTLLLTGTLALAPTGTQAQSVDEHSKQGRPWEIVGVWFAATPTGIVQGEVRDLDGQCCTRHGNHLDTEELDRWRS